MMFMQQREKRPWLHEGNSYVLFISASSIYTYSRLELYMMKKPVYTLDEMLLAALMLLFHVLCFHSCYDDNDDDYAPCFVGFIWHSKWFQKTDTLYSFLLKWGHCSHNIGWLKRFFFFKNTSINRRMLSVTWHVSPLLLFEWWVSSLLEHDVV